MHCGHVEIKFLKSKLLNGNRAGENPARPVHVYLPPEASQDPDRRFPVLYVLAPWTAAGRQQFDWKPFKESLPCRLERLVNEGRQEPVVVVAPDLYTRFGGSQYINSSYFGPHADHVVNELIPFVEQHFPVLPGAKHRAAFGRSSGGYGALRFAMDFDDVFAAVACHSGDMGFELLFGSDLHSFPRLLARYKGDVLAFLDHAFSTVKLSSSDVHLLMLLGSAGFYSPDPLNPIGFSLPIDLYTGEVDEEVWRVWKQNDPVSLAEGAADRLRRLNYLYLECGRFDQYHLLYGARQLHAKFEQLKVRHDYREFDDNHSGTDYRYDESLPRLIENIGQSN